MRLLRNLMTMTAALLTAFASLAGEYPEKPIKMVVAWPAGGGTDSVARIVAQYLGERLKQPVLVDNRGGASGMVGTEYVARAAPDGYTIQYTVADSHSINPHVFPKVPYDAKRDFVPVAVVGTMPSSLIVNPKVPAKNLSEYIALAKAEPGKLTYGSWGIGSGGHIRMEAFNTETGIHTLHVPYQGSGPALLAVIGGQIDGMMVPLGLADSHARTGKVRILGVDTLERVKSAPDIPTFTEQGVPLTLTFWQGILVPAGTPDAIVQKLNREVNAVLADPKAQAALEKVGVVVNAWGTKTAAQTKVFMDEEYERWGKTIRNAKIVATQ